MMICTNCGGRCIWCGPLSALTHTQCDNCKAINSQIVYDEDGNIQEVTP